MRLSGQVYDGEQEIADFGGVAKPMPVFAACFGIVTMSSIGLPLLNGFVGEFLILLGAFLVNPLVAALATSGVVLAAVYMLWMYRRVMFGPVEVAENRSLIDLGLRARLAGWGCRSVPSAVVFHKYSAASAAYSPLKAFLVERNRAWVALKCLPAPLLLASPVFTALRLAAQAWGVVSRRGAAGRFASTHSAAELLLVLVRAYAAALRGLPGAWRKRRAVQHRRRVSTWEAIGWLRRHRMSVREVALKD